MLSHVIRAHYPRRPLAPFLGLAPTCPEETRGISHSPSPTLLPTDCPLTCHDRVGATAHHSLKSFRCNTYGSPRKCCKQKTYGEAKSCRCNTYKKQGVPPSSQILFSVLAPPPVPIPPILRILFQVPYPVSPLLATLAKTPGVWGYSSHFGTERGWS